MGDIADQWTETGEDEWFEDLDDGDYSPPLQCQYCGSTAVQWAKDEDGKWHLHNNAAGDLHECNFDKLLDAS